MSARVPLTALIVWSLLSLTALALGLGLSLPVAIASRHRPLLRASLEPEARNLAGRPVLAFAGIGRFFNVVEPSRGGSYTLDRGKADLGEEAPYANRHASSYRAIYDLADLDRSLYIHTTGQSGNPFSPFYRSLAERWAKVEYIEIATKRAEIDKAAIGMWKLTPP